jgi:hypothetical protein
MLVGGYLALVLTAVPAAGEISSVDAYGGQAQVLGPPVHRHGAASGSTGTQGSRRAGGQSTGATGSQAGVGSAESSSGSGSHATPGSSSGAPTTPSGSNSAPGAAAGNGAVGGDESGAADSRDGAAAPVAGTGGSGASGAGQSPPIAATNVADVSNGSLSLSALDVLLLVAVFIALAGVGVLIRRWSRQSE